MRRIAIAGAAIATSHIAFAIACWIVRRGGGDNGERRSPAVDAGERPPLCATRIELADLRERIRSLERIAAGIDC